ncbi:hypothetical protein ACFZC5_14100 [Nocardia gamkensis]|uniref:hypothetical protein n=1 Tax=Nocardia gamkensis TaxID=352869 RepID=UPI0036E9FA2B
MNALLPSEFADLEPFAETWCLETEPERYARRLAASMDDMQRFYDAITPRAEAAMKYLDEFALDELPDDARRLLWLLYSMVMVSFPVEVWSQPRVPDSGAAMLDCLIEPRP